MVLEKTVRAFVVVLLALCFLEWLSWFTASVPPCLIQDEQATNHDSQKDCPTFYAGSKVLLARLDHIIEAHDKSIVAAFTVVLACSTIGLWLATVGLERSTKKLWEAGERQISVAQHAANAAERSAIVSERSLVELQRALIVPTKFEVDALVRGQQVIGYQISAMVENTGATPAKNFTGTANIVVWDGNLPDDFKYPDRTVAAPPHGYVGPKVAVPYPIGIAIQDLVDIAAKKKRGFMYGWVEYNDIFETAKRRTEFCTEIEVIGNPHIHAEKAKVLAFGVVGRHNGIDNDCLYKPGERPPIGGSPAAHSASPGGCADHIDAAPMKVGYIAGLCCVALKKHLRTAVAVHARAKWRASGGTVT